MKLMTKALEEEFAKQGDTSQMKAEEIKVIAKFFNPCGSGTWYASEYNPEERMFFGFVSLFGDHNDELGYFSLDELESVVGPIGLGIERDLHFEPGSYTLHQLIYGGERP